MMIMGPGEIRSALKAQLFRSTQVFRLVSCGWIDNDRRREEVDGGSFFVAIRRMVTGLSFVDRIERGLRSENKCCHGANSGVQKWALLQSVWVKKRF
jgi:hypothetical protein